MSHHYGVVVAVDGSRASHAAVRWAAAEAARRGASLYVVHICEFENASLWPTPSLQADLRQLSQPIVTEAIAEANQVAPEVTVTGEVLMGGTTRMLIGLSRSADLLVLGRSGKGSLARHLVGSLTSRMAAHAQCPMVAVPAAPDGGDGPAAGFEPAGKIVVGMGYHPTEGRALRFAVAEAELRHGAATLAVRAWHGPAGLAIDPDNPPVSPMFAEEAEQHALSAELVDKLRDVSCHQPPRPVVRAGQPSGVLSGLCHPGDLLVLGQHRHNQPFMPATAGRVIAECLHQAPCPVAVVPEPVIAIDTEPRRVAETAGFLGY